MPRGLPQFPSGRHRVAPGCPVAARFCLRGRPPARAQEPSPSVPVAKYGQPAQASELWGALIHLPAVSPSLASCRHAITLIRSEMPLTSIVHVPPGKKRACQEAHGMLLNVKRIPISEMPNVGKNAYLEPVKSGLCRAKSGCPREAVDLSKCGSGLRASDPLKHRCHWIQQQCLYFLDPPRGDDD